MAITYLALLIAAIITNSLLAFWLVRKSDRTGMIISFVIFLFAIGLWAFPQVLINGFAIDGDLYPFINRISSFGYIFIPVSFLIFSYYYIDRGEDLKNFKLLSFIFIPAFIFLFLSFSTNLILVQRPESIIREAWGITSPPGLLFPLLLIWILIVFFIALIKLVSFINVSGFANKKKQATFIVIAILIPIIIGTVTDGILPLFGYNPIPLAVPLSTVTALIIAYAIHKYQLFEFSPSTILSSLGEGVITVNEQARVITINKSAETMLGLNPKEIIGELFYKKIKLFYENGKAVPVRERPIVRVMKSKRRYFYKNYYIGSKKKNMFSIAFTVSPILRGKHVIGATVNFRDNTREHELEKNKDDFISIASHELKTPITALKLYAQILERQIGEKGDKKQKKSVYKINKQADKLSSLVGDLLNVSRIQTGKFEYRKTAFKLEDLIQDVLLDIKPTLNGRKIQRKGNVNAKIYGDMEKISQVLTNLVTNALKYSPNNKPVVLTTSKNKKMVVVKVKDYGQGIAKKDQDKLFERFYQGASSKKESGLGIGLYVSKEIITDHNGELLFKSQKGRGSTFYFTLPLYKK